MNKFNLEKDFYEILQKYDPAYKVEKIKVNISSTFMARSRCTECGGFPDYYYQVVKPQQWINVRSLIDASEWIKRWINRMTSSWYLTSEPKYFKDIREFSFILDGKHYIPTLYRARGTNIDDRKNVVEMLGCGCGATIWAFNDKSTKGRPEITNRKGRYKYPWSV